MLCASSQSKSRKSQVSNKIERMHHVPQKAGFLFLNWFFVPKLDGCGGVAGGWGLFFHFSWTMNDSPKER